MAESPGAVQRVLPPGIRSVPTALAAGSVPYTGTFRPVAALSAFDGKLLNGIWTLEIIDSVRKNTGTLVSWSLSAEV